jgi:hypothetical protein
MVYVSTSVEFDGRLQFELLDEVAGVEGVGMGAESFIEVRDVCFVVPIVMQVHNLARDRRFEGLWRFMALATVA